MTKYFCDKCGEEITVKNACTGGSFATSRMGTVIEFRPFDLDPYAPAKRFKIEVMTSLDGQANDGCFCKYCVLDALFRLDDRPRAKAGSGRVSHSKD